MRAVVVTGGSDGIGAALCRQLAADEGVVTFLGSRDKAKGDAVCAAVKNASPDADIRCVQLDVCDAASVTAAAAAVEAALGGAKLYAVVNNAGVGLKAAASRDVVFETNYEGPKRVVGAFMRLLDPSCGRVVNVGSGAGPSYVGRDYTPVTIKKALTSLSPTQDSVEGALAAGRELGGVPEENKDFAAYGLSKACLASWTMCMAAAHPNLTWACCSPGFIDTKLVAGFGATKKPEEVVVIRHCLFQELPGNGYYYGSDAVRSPYHFMRNPGEPPYDGAEPSF